MTATEKTDFEKLLRPSFQDEREIELGELPPKDDAVNHPTHYTSHPSGVECIQVTRHMNFNLGNAVKYIWRAGLKGSRKVKLIEDLKKARWYLDDEIKKLEGNSQ